MYRLRRVSQGILIAFVKLASLGFLLLLQAVRKTIAAMETKKDLRMKYPPKQLD
jgi:hypothetical protein